MQPQSLSYSPLPAAVVWLVLLFSLFLVLVVGCIAINHYRAKAKEDKRIQERLDGITRHAFTERN